MLQASDTDTRGRVRGLCKWLALAVTRAYLARFSLVLALFLLVYPLTAGWLLPTMLRSTLVLTARELAVVTTLAIAAAMTVVATYRIVMLHGASRFDLVWLERRRAVGLPVFIAYAVLVSPLLVTAATLSAGEGRLGLWWTWWSLVAGVVSGSAVMWISGLGHAALTHASDELPALVVPVGGRWMSAAHARPLPPWLGGSGVTRILNWLRAHCGPGYFNAQGRLLPGHAYEIALFGVYFAVYILGYLTWRPGSRVEAWAPALGYLLILVTLGTWLLSTLAFWLDRYRAPVLTLLALLSFATWTVSKSDHHFSLRPANAGVRPLLTPAQIAQQRRHPLLSVVAIDGGGIHSAAWSAEVLSNIHAEWPAFNESVRLVSAVSGGAVTAMRFVSRGSERPPTADELRALRDFGRRRALAAVVWGAAYPDLWRMLVPIPGFARFEEDRGWALEETWRLAWPEGVPTLNDLRVGIDEGWRPALSLNATQIESGEPFILSTFAVPAGWRFATLDTTFPGRDIDITTAARLSAAFPYVTPISRARPDRNGEIPAWHFGDGGYYDETGMEVALKWLDTALSDPAVASPGTTVAFVQVRSRPHPETAPRDRGWLYQTIGPAQAFYAVRLAAQRDRVEFEFDLLRRVWQSRGVEIKRFEFAFDRVVPPLSWQLSPGEAEDIAAEWGAEANRETLAALLVLARSAEDARPDR